MMQNFIMHSFTNGAPYFLSIFELIMSSLLLSYNKGMREADWTKRPALESVFQKTYGQLHSA